MNLSYTLSDGQERYEKGTLTNFGDARVYEVSGHYAFVGTDGKTYRVNYTSGVNGYRTTTEGTHFCLKCEIFDASFVYFLLLEVAKISLHGFQASINSAVDL